MEEKKRPGYGKEVEAIIAKEVSAGAKDEIVDTYEDLLRAIWNRIVITLGVVTVVTIMERAIHMTSAQYPTFQSLKVTDEGIAFKDFKAQAGEENKEIIKGGFKELIANLFNILAKLTGTVLVDRLIKEVGI